MLISSHSPWCASQSPYCMLSMNQVVVIYPTATPEWNAGQPPPPLPSLDGMLVSPQIIEQRINSEV